MQRKQTKKQDLAAAMPPGSCHPDGWPSHRPEASSFKQQATSTTKRPQLKGIK